MNARQNGWIRLLVVVVAVATTGCKGLKGNTGLASAAAPAASSLLPGSGGAGGSSASLFTGNSGGLPVVEEDSEEGAVEVASGGAASADPTEPVAEVTEVEAEAEADASLFEGITTHVAADLGRRETPRYIEEVEGGAPFSNVGERLDGAPEEDSSDLVAFHPTVREDGSMVGATGAIEGTVPSVFATTPDANVPTDRRMIETRDNAAAMNFRERFEAAREAAERN